MHTPSPDTVAALAAVLAKPRPMRDSTEEWAASVLTALGEEGYLLVDASQVVERSTVSEVFDALRRGEDLPPAVPTLEERYHVDGPWWVVDHEDGDRYVAGPFNTDVEAATERARRYALAPFGARDLHLTQGLPEGRPEVTS